MHRIVESTTVDDALYFYKTVKLVKPGGLSEASEYDITKNSFPDLIRRDAKTLYDLFQLSAEWDSISGEWVTGYKVTYTIGEPAFTSTLKNTGDLNTAIVHTFLKILSLIPDSLIKRKAGDVAAREVTVKAGEALRLGGLTTPEGRDYVVKLDRELQESRGLLNPGSTADLTAASIMVALNKKTELPLY